MILNRIRLVPFHVSVDVTDADYERQLGSGAANWSRGAVTGPTYAQDDAR